ncbi:MAG: HPr family phosphocarrier protein [Pseudomonadota bacterium]
MSISFSVIVKNEGGLHARPCSILVQYAISNGLDMIVSYNDRDVSAHSLLDVLSLCVPKGSEVNIQIAQDEHGACGTIPIEEAEQDIKGLFATRFGMKK